MEKQRCQQILNPLKSESFSVLPDVTSERTLVSIELSW